MTVLHGRAPWAVGSREGWECPMSAPSLVHVPAGSWDAAAATLQAQSLVVLSCPPALLLRAEDTL